MILLVFLLVFVAHANAQCRVNDRTVSCRDYEDFAEGNVRGMEIVIIGRLRGVIDIRKSAIQRFVVLHSEVRCEEIVRNHNTMQQINGMTCQVNRLIVWSWTFLFFFFLELIYFKQKSEETTLSAFETWTSESDSPLSTTRMMKVALIGFSKYFISFK